MPFPVAAALVAGGGILQSILGGSAQNKANQANIDQANYMYDRSRTDALTDRAFENNYNSPAENMKRMKAAGLNPHLIYDKGSAVTSSSSTKPSANVAPKIEAFKPDMSFIGQALQVQAEVNNKQAQTNLLKQNLEVQKETEMLTNVSIN